MKKLDGAGPDPAALSRTALRPVRRAFWYGLMQGRTEVQPRARSVCRSPDVSCRIHEVYNNGKAP